MSAKRSESGEQAVHGPARTMTRRPRMPLTLPAVVGREQELYTDVCVVGRRVLVTENKGQAQGHKHVPNLVPLEGGDVTRGNP